MESTCLSASIVIINSIAYILTLCRPYPVVKMGFYKNEGITKVDGRDDGRI